MRTMIAIARQAARKSIAHRNRQAWVWLDTRGHVRITMAPKRGRTLLFRMAGYQMMQPQDGQMNYDADNRAWVEA